MIALPTDIAEMINTQIGATKGWNGQYTVDCSTVPNLPDLTFYFGGKPFPLKGTDYILEVQGTCISSFQGMDINLPWGSLWIIGKCLCANLRLYVSLNLMQVMSSCAATTRSTILSVMRLVSRMQSIEKLTSI